MSCCCGNGIYTQGCCPTCQPSNTIYQCGCPDPGTVTVGAHLAVLDGQFCERRLVNAAGLTYIQQTSSGTFQVKVGSAPVANLNTFTWSTGQEFGDLVAIGSDGVMRQLQGPATPDLFPRTNAAGNLIFGTLPAQTIPDPLTVTTINATNANLTNLTATGPAVFSGLNAGTIAQIVGLDASNNLVRGGNSSGIQVAAFFESPSSPSATYPNATAVSGSNLIIGNQLFDSGGALITVTNSQTLTVAVAGTYVLFFEGLTSINASGNRFELGIWLTINGVVVNKGNSCEPGFLINGIGVSGMEARNLAVGDVIRLQLNANTSSVRTSQVRLVAIKVA